MKYFQEADIAVTVCDREGRIIDMNNQSREVNLKPGQELIGCNVLDCHPEPARTMLEDMMHNERKHVYTIERNSSTRSPGTKTANTWDSWSYPWSSPSRWIIRSGVRR